jgi:hypothetical protein
MRTFWGRDRFVYLMRRSGLYAIGNSIDPDARAKLRGAEVVHRFRSGDAPGIVALLQRRFSAKHVSEEWFRLDKGDIRLLRSVDRCDGPQDLPQELRPRCRARLVPVELTGELHARLAALARAAGRSVGQEILLLIECHVGDPRLPPGELPQSIDYHPTRAGGRRGPE